jgi:hypothetical protein
MTNQQLTIDPDILKTTTSIGPYPVGPLQTTGGLIISGHNTTHAHIGAISSINIEPIITTKYIIAGNIKEYDDFITKRNLSKLNYVFVYSADNLRGLNNIHGFYVGSWRERKDIEEIKSLIELANGHI